GDGHGVASGRVDEVVVALGAEVKACVAATPWVCDDRFSAGVNDDRPDIVLVVRLGVVTALGGQDKRIRIDWIDPPNHPVLATKTIVGRRCPSAVGAIRRLPHQAAQTPGQLMLAGAYMLLAG